MNGEESQALERERKGMNGEGGRRRSRKGMNGPVGERQLQSEGGEDGLERGSGGGQGGGNVAEVVESGGGDEHRWGKSGAG
jgi:hypothetical protein